MIDIEEVIKKLSEAEEILYYYKLQNPDNATAAEAHAQNRATLEKVYAHAKELEATTSRAAAARS